MAEIDPDNVKEALKMSVQDLAVGTWEVPVIWGLPETRGVPATRALGTWEEIETILPGISVDLHEIRDLLGTWADPETGGG